MVVIRARNVDFFTRNSQLLPHLLPLLPARALARFAVISNNAVIVGLGIAADLLMETALLCLVVAVKQGSDTNQE